ncbi:MAG TPA: hypothetical protein VL137_05230, partial [Polyangiaceae bacterium]|nr:hypothetical protein [Polyangiaceae bacterium]
GGTGGTGGTAQCTVANQATTCNDNKPCTDDSCVSGACMHANNTAPCTDDGDGCTDDVCGGGACTHPMNTAPCTGDYDLCTDDVCAAGTCTHPALNPCGGLVKIQTNRGGGANYVKLDANNQLVWTATTLATAETFQLTFTGTDQVKMMATSNNMWVTLDQTNDNDFLVANGAAAANAATINIVLCAAVNALASSCAPNCRGMEVVDDNSSKFVASDDQGVAVGDLLRARSGDCGGSATAWESWRFVEQ